MSDLLTTILVALATRGIWQSARFSAGPHTPAVDDGRAGWCVLDWSQAGVPVAFAGDVFDCAHLAALFESGEISPGPGWEPIEWPSAERRQAIELGDRWHHLLR